MKSLLSELILLGDKLQTTGVGKPRNGAHQLNSFYTMVSLISIDFNSHGKLQCGALNLFFVFLWSFQKVLS